MGKSSGTTRRKNPSGNGAKSEKELIQGFKNYMELYYDDAYTNADRKAFEKMVESSEYEGVLYRGTVLPSMSEEIEFIENLIAHEGEYITDLNSFTPRSGMEEMRSAGFTIRERNVVSFSKGHRPEYSWSDDIEDNEGYQAPVIFRTSGRKVAGKDLKSEGEVAVSIKKTKFKVKSVKRVSSDYFPSGYYWDVRLD